MRMPVDVDDWSLDLPEEWQEEEVARLSLWAQVKFLPALGRFVRETATALGLGQKSARELEHAVDEAATNVIQHAFPGGSGQYTLIMLRRPGQVVAALEDRGIPFDLEKFRHGESTGLGYVLIKEYADELRAYNRGPKGKRLEIIKKLHFDDVTAYHSADELSSLAQAGPAPLDEPLAICRMEPDHAVALARCVYRAHGYSYLSEYIYFPDQIREMLDLGRMVSCVAVNLDEEIVGHGAILPERPDAKVAEIAQTLMDPRYQGHDILPKILKELLDQSKATGMYGLYGFAPASPLSMQEMFLDLQGQETGVLLGHGPAEVAAEEMPGENQNQRRTDMIYYFPLNQGPALEVYAPPHFEERIMGILTRCGLKRRIGAEEEKPEEQDEASLLDIKAHGQWGRAYILIKQYGPDVLEQVQAQLKELCRQGLDCIYLDLPLSDPATAARGEVFEGLGFIFGGVLPEMPAGGDVLRLQFLNSPPSDLDAAQTASDWGRELFDFVKGKYLAAGSG